MLDQNKPQNPEATPASGTNTPSNNAPEMQRTIREQGQKIDMVVKNLERTQALLQDVAMKKVEESVKTRVVEDDDEWLSEFNTNPRKKLEEVKAQAKDEALKDMEKRQRASQKQQEFDSKAFGKYPQLRDPNHPLRKEAEAVIRELEAEEPGWGKKPTALYEAAQIAYARAVENGDIIPDSFKDEAMRYINTHDSAVLPYRGGSNSKKGELTKSQEIWAKRLNVPVEKYAKYMSNDDEV